jgi:hypothetical protein
MTKNFVLNLKYMIEDKDFDNLKEIVKRIHSYELSIIDFERNFLFLCIKYFRYHLNFEKIGSDNKETVKKFMRANEINKFIMLEQGPFRKNFIKVKK